MQAISARKLLYGLAPQEFLSDTLVTHVTSDSRTLCEGCVFVAFVGARVDGHDFAKEAVEKGAVYVVVNHHMVEIPDEKQIICTESYAAMMRIGTNYRADLTPQIIGVTGSVGKTTTKEFCDAIFSTFGQTIKTFGNENNELGVPRTLLRMDSCTEYAVVEMGMNHIGEIERLAIASKPCAGIITNIGTAHIENLGSRENICKAKLELCAGLAEGAPLALPFHDEFLRKAELPKNVKVVWFALEDNCAEVWAEELVINGEGQDFILHDKLYGDFDVYIPALGKHSVLDALSAYCVATRLGLDASKSAKALGNFKQTGMRQKIVKAGDVTVIEDCYNANPDSMKAALEMFKEFPAEQKIAYLGDMFELGEFSKQAHIALGEAAAKAGLVCLVCIGEAGRWIAQAAVEQGQYTLYANNKEEAAQMLLAHSWKNDAILVKASRGMALEETLQIFYKQKQKDVV